MSASLVGSEMCIRDRCDLLCSQGPPRNHPGTPRPLQKLLGNPRNNPPCLLYTSDAADDMQ
eukprot:5171324-Alexandrium_andersonii.AAC.1